MWDLLLWLLSIEHSLEIPQVFRVVAGLLGIFSPMSALPLGVDFPFALCFHGVSHHAFAPLLAVEYYH